MWDEHRAETFLYLDTDTLFLKRGSLPGLFAQRAEPPLIVRAGTQSTKNCVVGHIVPPQNFPEKHLDAKGVCLAASVMLVNVTTWLSQNTTGEIERVPERDPTRLRDARSLRAVATTPRPRRGRFRGDESRRTPAADSVEMRVRHSAETSRGDIGATFRGDESWRHRRGAGVRPVEPFGDVRGRVAASPRACRHRVSPSPPRRLPRLVSAEYPVEATSVPRRAGASSRPTRRKSFGTSAACRRWWSRSRAASGPSSRASRTARAAAARNAAASTGPRSSVRPSGIAAPRSSFCDGR